MAIESSRKHNPNIKIGVCGEHAGDPTSIKFLSKLKNISDPEKKRKIIGNLFIKIFDRYAKKIKNVKY